MGKLNGLFKKCLNYYTFSIWFISSTISIFPDFQRLYIRVAWPIDDSYSDIRGDKVRLSAAQVSDGVKEGDRCKVKGSESLMGFAAIVAGKYCHLESWTQPEILKFDELLRIRNNKIGVIWRMLFQILTCDKKQKSTFL